jgi:hypothetical protein
MAFLINVLMSVPRWRNLKDFSKSILDAKLVARFEG